MILNATQYLLKTRISVCRSLRPGSHLAAPLWIRYYPIYTVYIQMTAIVPVGTLPATFPGPGPDPGPCVLLEARGHRKPSWSWRPRDRVLPHLWVCPAGLSPGAFTVGMISFGSKWRLFPPGSPLLVTVLPVSDLTSRAPLAGRKCTELTIRMRLGRGRADPSAHVTQRVPGRGGRAQGLRV